MKKRMKKGLIFGLMLLMALVLTAPAQAALIVADWRLDFSGIDGLGADATVGSLNTGIQQIIYSGVSHTEIVIDVGPAGSSVGDTTIFDGHLSGSSYKYNDGIQNIGTQFGGLNLGYELTFDVTDVVRVISQDLAGTQTFVHIPAGTYGGQTSDNLLEIWVNNFANIPPDAQANTVTGDGYTDGVMVARLINPPEPGDGGTFSQLALDGSDDATFKLNRLICPTCFMLPGVFWGDTNGDGILEDLSQYDGIGNPFIASALLTDNNFDADANNDGIPDFTAPTNWAAYFPTRLSAGGPPFIGVYATNDGSASMVTQVREPATLLLVGFGLLGLGFYSSRKKK